MAVSKERRARSTSHKESIGLMAIGSSGPWEIAIDQTTSGPDRWFAQIEGPSVYLYFEIASPECIDQASQFLSESQGETRRNVGGVRNGMLTLGHNETTPVNLIRDNEYPDRYFLLVEPKNGPVVRFTVTGNDLKYLTDALRQAKEDIESE